MTYSLVARDEETGQLGVAVQSPAFRTGAVCAWARAGVGAIATQSFTDVRYGVRGLELLAAFRSGRGSLASRLLVEADGRWLDAFDRYERLGFLPPGTTARLT